MSPRKLWSLTTPRGDIPCIKAGRLVRYDPVDLREWIDRTKLQGVSESPEGGADCGKHLDRQENRPSNDSVQRQ
ncbi:helix-turn-helix domain-containing protein [Stratiformator vulcanicus]|uniref:helix-turn-helix domain-containing protein n=1 Tax=Stratiformator vulcanicus TaxID=2527980 RepID=UPI00119E4636